MKRTIYMVCIIALLSAIVVITPASATTWDVYEGESIQDAIDGASDGDTVFVHAGTYVLPFDGEFHIFVPTPNITLKGEGADVVILDGNGGGLAIYVGINPTTHSDAPAPGCIVEGFRIVNASYGIGVTRYCPNCIIRNNVIIGGLRGIDLSEDIQNTTIMSNVVSNTTYANYAFRFRKSSNMLFINNTYINNVGAVALYDSATTNNTITRNNIISNGAGIKLYSGPVGNRIYLNNIVNNTNTVVIGGSGTPSNIWNSTSPIEYTYGGTTYTSYLGNYWGSNYTGVDTSPEDGIGDTPYDIPGSATDKDYRPLMTGFENYPEPAAEEPAPWEGYLVPQDSTGNYGEDIPVDLWVEYNATGLTYGAVAYQVDLHFDPGCVNVTSANFSTSPFGSHMVTPYAPGVVRILEDNYTTMTPIPSGTYKMATLTLHGESLAGSASDLWFDPVWCVVSDTDGNAIENSYTNGTYTCAAQPQLFDTGRGGYPSIAGTHTGTIVPDRNIRVNRLYTYPCAGTGGHAAYARLWNETTGACVEAYWNGYKGDYHNISFNQTLTMQQGVLYHYQIQTGSYPQLILAPSTQADGGRISGDNFVDGNGAVREGCIPAILLWLDE
jgi:nitrous oxidase accessory protein NosD